MIVIENGLVFDGTGAAPVKANVLVRDGIVREIAQAPIEAPNARRIDAAGQWVTPGFLDTHTHYDAELLASPGLEESVRHGVTSILMGSCSISTIYSSPLDCADFFARVEALPHGDVQQTLENKKDWSSPAEYITSLERRPLGPNVMAFAGHSDIRTSVLGLERAVDPKVRPTREEQKKMEALLEEGLDAGLLGMSSMTNPWDKVGGERYRSSRLPSTYATWGEYRAFHKILRRRNRILQSAPNITTKANIVLFFLETIGVLRKTLKTTLITAADAKSSPMLIGPLLFATRMLNKFFRGDLKWQSVPMPFEVYADGMDLVVFEEFGSGEAALHLADEVERNALIKDEAYRRRFRRDYERQWTPRVWHRDFYDATIVGAPDSTLVGKSFGQVADERELHPVDAFLDLVVEYGAKLRWKTTIGNHRPHALEGLLADDNVQVGFSDSGAHVRNMAFYNFPLHFLRMVKNSIDRNQPLMTMEKAVHKLTGALADWYDVDAGRLRVGDRADISIIDPAGLNGNLDEYHEAPMDYFGGLSRMVRRNDDAVTATIIAGKVAYEGGAFTEGYGTSERYGSFLRAGQKIPPPATKIAAPEDVNMERVA